MGVESSYYIFEVVISNVRFSRTRTFAHLIWQKMVLKRSIVFQTHQYLN